MSFIPSDSPAPSDVQQPDAPTSVQDAAAAASSNLAPPSPSVVALSGPTPDTAPPAPSAPAPVAEGKPSLWRSVVSGALAGLAGSAGATSFGGGLSRGAAGALEQQRQQKLDALAASNQASEIKYRDAQSLMLVNEAHLNDFKLSALPQQLQDEHAAASLGIMKDFQGLGISPIATISGNHDNATAALQQMTAIHGAVPPLLTLHLGNQLVAYDLSQLASSDGNETLSLVNKYGRAQGLPDIASGDWAQMKPEQRENKIQTLASSLNPVPDPSKIEMQVATAQNLADNYKNQPAWKQDPQIAAQLNKNVTFLKSAQTGFDAHQASQAARIEAAKAAAAQPYKASPELDRSYQFNSGQLEKLGSPIDSAIQRFGRLQDTVNQKTPQADALIAPELLTVMAGGAGSGLRMNEAEISRIVGGRSNFESLQAAVNKFDPNDNKALSITDPQRQQIQALMGEVYGKLQKKQTILDGARQQLINAASQTEHRQIVANTHKQLDAVDAGPATFQVTAPNGKVYSFPTQEAANTFKSKAGVK